MNTPTHVIVSLAALPKQDRWGGASAVVAGAVLPDAPMFAFYAYQKLLGTPERDIWGDHYFRDGWQLLFDVFNSFPLFLALLALSWWLGWQWGMLLAGSAMLHLVGDLPLHNDDAHRHFLPFTDWRFYSPVSYWDPKHFGRWAAMVEAAVAVALAAWLVWPGNTGPNRWTAGVLLPILVAQTIAVSIFAWTYCEQATAPPPGAATGDQPPAITASDGPTSQSSTP